MLDSIVHFWPSNISIFGLPFSNLNSLFSGRTGRCGKTGVATSFINLECDETLLLDLKHLLKEAKQKIPPVLQTLDDPTGWNSFLYFVSFHLWRTSFSWLFCLRFSYDLSLRPSHSCAICEIHLYL